MKGPEAESGARESVLCPEHKGQPGEVGRGLAQRWVFTYEQQGPFKEGVPVRVQLEKQTSRRYMLRD